MRAPATKAPLCATHAPTITNASPSAADSRTCIETALENPNLRNFGVTKNTCAPGRKPTTVAHPATGNIATRDANAVTLTDQGTGRRDPSSSNGTAEHIATDSVPTDNQIATDAAPSDCTNKDRINAMTTISPATGAKFNHAAS